MADQHDRDSYRAYVGPADQYDVIGAAQFALLYALGLRERHRLLDIGCGSLRAGRMFIPYLAKGNYTGVDPNAWLIHEAIERELGADILAIKEPQFDFSSDFALTNLGQFNFVLAQGVGTNTGPALLHKLLAGIKDTLAHDGLAAVTFIHPGSGDNDAVRLSIDDLDAPGWRYPGCYSYVRAEIAEAIELAGLIGEPIGWFHPRHQWWLLPQPGRPSLPVALLSALKGATFADGFEEAGLQTRPQHRSGNDRHQSRRF